MLEITDIQIIFPNNNDKNNRKLKCFVNIVFNEIFIIRNLRIIEGGQKFFVVMPSFKKNDGSFQDIAHPLTNDFRQLLEDSILEKYEEELNKRRSKMIVGKK
jgi:stage V sporulation protein G